MRNATAQEIAILRPEKPDDTARLAEQAIASMRDTVNNNQVVMAEIARQIGHRPKEFLIQRDGSGDMVKIIPVYEDAR